MRRRALPLLVPALALALSALLCACGGSSAGSGGTSLPTVKGSYGDKPRITVAKGEKPSAKLQSTVLEEGDGPRVGRGDLLVADYLGAIYRSGKVFDNSYDHKQPAAFPLKTGQGGVISGWVKSLTGVRTGSRVLMVLPPKEGYGKRGNPQAGIKGTDTLVFVVDVIADYGSKVTTPAPQPVSGLDTDLPQVTGDWGAEPAVTVPKGTTPPTKATTTVLATGSGAKISKQHLIVVQYTAVSWAGEQLSKTWGGPGPQGVPVGAVGAQPGTNPFDLLIGVPVGSRVLLTLPAQTKATAATESVAVVIDILGQHGPAKEEAAS